MAQLSSVTFRLTWLLTQPLLGRHSGALESDGQVWTGHRTEGDQRDADGSSHAKENDRDKIVLITPPAQAAHDPVYRM